MTHTLNTVKNTYTFIRTLQIKFIFFPPIHQLQFWIHLQLSYRYFLIRLVILFLYHLLMYSLRGEGKKSKKQNIFLNIHMCTMFVWRTLHSWLCLFYNIFRREKKLEQELVFFFTSVCVI